MAYLGIGYSGGKDGFLETVAAENSAWLTGERKARLFGDAFLVMYDSNTAREFAKKCLDADDENSVVVYQMERL